MEKNELRVVDIPIKEVKPYINNPRYNENAVLGVAASIKAYGFQQPIVVDRNMVIIAGHTRYKAAQLLNLELIPVAFADDLTPEQARAYRLVDNKTAEFATFDTELLGETLDRLSEKEYLFPYDYDLGDVEIDPDMRLEFMGTDTVTNDPKKNHEKKDIICPHCGYNLTR